MDDLGLFAKIDVYTKISVCPIEPETYNNCIEDDVLGGSSGYFILRSSDLKSDPSLEILAKAPTFEAASQIFYMITKNNKVAA